MLVFHPVPRVNAVSNTCSSSSLPHLSLLRTHIHIITMLFEYLRLIIRLAWGWVGTVAIGPVGGWFDSHSLAAWRLSKAGKLRKFNWEEWISMRWNYFRSPYTISSCALGRMRKAIKRVIKWIQGDAVHPFRIKAVSSHTLKQGKPPIKKVNQNNKDGNLEFAYTMIAQSNSTCYALLYIGHLLLECSKGDLMLFNLQSDPAFLKVQGTTLQLGKVEGTTPEDLQKLCHCGNTQDGTKKQTHWKTWGWEEDSGDKVFLLKTPAKVASAGMCKPPRKNIFRPPLSPTHSTAPSRVPVTANSFGPATHRACVIHHSAEFEHKQYLTLPSLRFSLTIPNDDNDNKMGCNGEHSTPAPVPRALPMITVTIMATALTAHIPDDDNMGCDSIPPPAPCMLGGGITYLSPCHTSSNDDDTGCDGGHSIPAPVQHAPHMHPDNNNEMSHDRGSTPAPSPHPCCPLLRAPSMMMMKSNPSVAAPSHAAQ
ncbi:hypothetical protein EDB83DRAFT_2325585 [Lactarius deliciosus]|nr:hypothetical protein EDB83DRAFT_2325585 [Lactarius deliciosus]